MTTSTKKQRPREFDGLSPREAQEALAAELSGELSGERDDDYGDDMRTDETRANPAEDDASEERRVRDAGDVPPADNPFRRVTALAEDGESHAAIADETDDDPRISDDPGAEIETAEMDELEADTEQAAEPEHDEVWTAAQMAEHLKMLEALLFASAEPVDKATLMRRLPDGADIPALIDALAQQYENRGVILSKAAGKYRFVTNPEVAHILQEERNETRKLSRAALETLAIIAYHQPCTRADIEDVRGVAVSKGSLDQLLEIGWVRLRGRRKDSPGRPVLYGTSSEFLEHFNLESVGDLPGMADLRAAGLLDARLPPGFSIPSPSDGGSEDDDGDEDGTGGEGADFVRDFHDEDGFGEDDKEAMEAGEETGH